jgi:FHS family L-fucose permease-like MFS transporter
LDLTLVAVLVSWSWVSNLGNTLYLITSILTWLPGVSGGAVFPPIQAAIADAANTRISYVVPLVGFCFVLAYTAFHWVRHGFPILRIKSDAVIATSMEGGAVGGVVSTVHYDEKRLSVSAVENIRRSSVGAVSVKGATGGVNFR